MSEKKLIVVAGPTAVGKTAVSVQMARALSTVIVSADSRQIFREMTVGTAKPSPEQRAAVQHYFVDTHSVGEDYDAARYATDALALIHNLFLEHDQVILCGGSGLYIRGVCEGFDEMPRVPDDIRHDLMENYQLRGITWLQEQMQALDPEGFKVIDQKNPHRLIRALEVRLHTGKSIVTFRKNKKSDHEFDINKIGLELPREELYTRIDDRMDQMIAAGLFEEARGLYPLRHNNALRTVGYQEIFNYMDNACDLEECVRLLKRNSRRYAKRQLTWFKKDPEFRWFHPKDLQGIIDWLGNKGHKGK